MATTNPNNLLGTEFIEFTGGSREFYTSLFGKLGFEFYGKHKTQNVDWYRQGKVSFLANYDDVTFSEDFSKMHGSSICAVGFGVENAAEAFESSVSKGAKPFVDRNDKCKFPAIYGIGDSLIYFIDDYGKKKMSSDDFEIVSSKTEGFGFKYIDHMTNNVPSGEMQKWCQFYENIFQFKETRFFDIKGKETGLVSKVMCSPSKRVIIPINEPTDSKSQIQEYIEEYKGSGIQHIAIATDDICKTVASMRAQGVEFLDVPDTYYDMIPERLPNIQEDMERLKELKILVDGDKDGYLLQIFTKNLVGPIFVEVIQRKNHDGFGEGNFQALFDAIERDQKDRGFL